MAQRPQILNEKWFDDPGKDAKFNRMLEELFRTLNADAGSLAAHIADPTDAHDASAISVTPTGTIAATDAQSAIAELDGDITTVSGGLAAHIADTSAAHAASAIGFTPAGNIAATDVQAAIAELDSEKAPSVSPVLTTPQINDTSADHQYVFAVSELAADRTVTLPLLTGADTFVFASHTQELDNKTLDSSVGKGTWTASGTWTLPAFTLGGTVSSNGQSFSGTIANLGTVTTADINGGTVDATVIGGASAAAATVTTLTATTASIAQGAITDPATALSVTSTWNDAADTFVGADINITNTASNASSKLQQWRVGGTVVAGVDVSGRFYIGPDASGAVFGLSGTSAVAANARVIRNTVTLASSTTTTIYGFENSPQFDLSAGAISGAVYNLFMEPGIAAAGGSNNIANFIGNRVILRTLSGYTGVIATGMGFSGSTPNLGGGVPITAYGHFHGAAITNGNSITSGTVTNHGANMLSSTAAAGAGGTVVNYGGQFGVGSGSSAGTTNYGVRISGNGGGASTNWALYSDSTAASYFAGAATVDGVATFNSSIALQNYTVATLPAGVQGYVAYVTDALAPAFLTAVVGGGAIVTPVFYNGAAWVAI